MNWLYWEFIGGIGQGVMLLAWLTQYYTTKKAGIGRTPMLFWIFTILSSLISLLYAWYLGSIIYLCSACFMIGLSAWNIKIEKKHWNWKQEKKDLKTITETIYYKINKRGVF